MSWEFADAVDSKGFPADKSKTGGWITAALILGVFFSHLFHIFKANFNFIYFPKIIPKAFYCQSDHIDLLDIIE